MEVAQSKVSVDKQTLAMKNDMSEQSKVVHHVSSSGPCTRCGKSNHVASHCPYKGFECLKCGKQGHLKQCAIAKIQGTSMVTIALVVAENGPDLVLDHPKQSMLRKLKKHRAS